jgi:enterochelin esterase-like enzyme
MYTLTNLPTILKVKHQLNSVYLKRVVELEFLYPEELLNYEKLNLLLLNDGQDLVELNLENTLVDLYSKRAIEPFLIVAISASIDRLQEYGVAGVPDFKGRGSKAAAYTNFIIKELYPFIETTMKLPVNGKRAIAGSSLGGLSAFDIAWNNESFFDAVGVFSASFWWRKKDLHDGYQNSDRIMHQVIKNHPGKPELKFWLMTGTEDETSDRNHNYIIDSIDDTIDIIKELIDKGYQRPSDIRYYEMVGGAHNVATWAKVFPSFLCWAFS